VKRTTALLLFLTACDSPKGACLETNATGVTCFEKRANRCTYVASHESPPVFHDARTCPALGYVCKQGETFAKDNGGTCDFGWVRAQ
jgi:hypothetical protein